VLLCTALQRGAAFTVVDADVNARSNPPSSSPVEANHTDVNNDESFEENVTNDPRSLMNTPANELSNEVTIAPQVSTINDIKTKLDESLSYETTTLNIDIDPDLLDSSSHTTESPEFTTFKMSAESIDITETTTGLDPGAKKDGSNMMPTTYSPIQDTMDEAETSPFIEELEDHTTYVEVETTTTSAHSDFKGQNTTVVSTEKSFSIKDWSYNGVLGTSTWPQLFPGCGSGLQSPVNISPRLTRPAALLPLQFRRHTAPSPATLSNDGRMAWVELAVADRPEVLGGGLRGAYAVRGVALRWGSGAARGSEHTINYVRYPLELQLVLVSARHGSAAQAVGQPDGLAALALLATAGPQDHPWLAALVQGLEAVRQPGTSTPLVLPPLASLLPNSTSLFYRYTGSLTSPPCPGPVAWTVLDQSVPVSHRQIAALRRLLDREGLPLQDNFRPAQPAGGRQIYRSAESFE